MTFRRLLLVLGSLSLTGLLPVSAEEAYYYSGGKKWPLTSSHQYVAVQTQKAMRSEEAKRTFRSVGDRINWEAFRTFPSQNVALLPVAKPSEAQEKQLASTLRQQGSVTNVFNVYGTQSSPIVVTADLVLQFKRTMSPAELQALAKKYQIEFVRPLGRYAPNGFLCRVLSSDSQSALTVADAIYEHEAVRFSHPDFVWPHATRFVPNDPLYPQQWHLKNTGQSGGTPNADVDAPEAWDLTQGSSSITIAVIDPTGTDIDHEDFQAPGKIAPGYNFANNTNNPRPASGDVHATAVSGIATAVGNNSLGVTGIAPGCRLMAIKLGDAVSTEADSFNYAANNGADVITNSWGPPDGLGMAQPQPDVTRTAVDYAATQGRNGKGCVIFWASGNGSESADLDGYASNPEVINVAASNDVDEHASYSDRGQSLAVCAPSSDYGRGDIVTTDRMGLPGYSSGNYATDFGGTSASSPLAAGIGALMLSVNSGLTWQQVKALLEQTADKIDTVHGNYNSSGHSIYLGFGRVNAFKAVTAAKAALPPTITITSITPALSSNDRSVSVTNLAGTGFKSGATVKLAMTGESDIAGASVAVVDSTKITCSFDVTGKRAGLWDVVVANPDGQTGTLQNGFRITGLTHDVAITSFTASPNPVNRGSAVTVNVTVQNLGDATENGVTFVMAYGNQTLIGPLRVPSWVPGKTFSGSFPINVPRSFKTGDYLVTGQLSAVKGETNTDNNAQTVKITIQ